jgi:zinc transporter ZupT
MIHQTISISLVAGLFLSNFPEALSSSRGMEEEGLSKKKIFIMWSSIALFTGIGALVGNILMQSATIGWFAFLQGIAAGAMLTMIAQTMLPEAYMKGGSVTGFSTLVGFLLTISLKGFE